MLRHSPMQLGEDVSKRLKAAVQTSDLDIIKRFLDENTTDVINTPLHCYHRSLLGFVIINRHLTTIAILQLLLDCEKVDINQINDQRTVLHDLLMSQPDHADTVTILELLLPRLNVIPNVSCSYLASVIKYASLETFDAFMVSPHAAKFVQVDSRLDGSGLLESAVMRGMPPILNRVLSIPGIEAQLNTVGEDRLTPLQVALKFSPRVEMVEPFLFMPTLNINAGCENDGGILIKALSLFRRNGYSHITRNIANYIALFELLIMHPQVDASQVDESGHTIAIKLIMSQLSVPSQDKLLRIISRAKNFSVQTPTKTGKTALMLAASKSMAAVNMILKLSAANLDAADEDGNSAIYYALVNHHFDFFKLLLEKGVDTNRVNKKGETLFSLACAYDGRIANLLVDKLADVNGRDAMGNTPLFYASAAQSLELVKRLLERGANVDCVNLAGESPILYMLSKIVIISNPDVFNEIIKLLVAKGMDAKRTDHEGINIVDHAVRFRSLPLINLCLYQWDVPLTATNIYSMLAFIFQQDSNKEEMLRRLVAKCRPAFNSVDKNGNSILMLAIRGKNKTVIEWLFYYAACTNFGLANHKGMTPIYEAYLQGLKDVALHLLKKGHPIIADLDSDTVLISAADRKDVAFIKEVLALYPESMSNTDELKLNVTANDGHSVLSTAVQVNTPELVRLLLTRNELDVNCRSSSAACSPLRIAIEKNSVEIAKLLIDDPRTDISSCFSATDSHTPITKALSLGRFELVEYLLDSPRLDLTGFTLGSLNMSVPLFEKIITHKTFKVNANINNPAELTILLSAIQENRPKVVNMLLALPGIELNGTANPLVKKPLLHAMCSWRPGLDMADRIGIIRALLNQATLNVEVCDSRGVNALMLSAFRHRDIFQLLLPRCMSLLNNVDADGLSALHYAVASRDVVIVRALLEAGIQVDICNRAGVTPIQLAQQKGYHQIKILIDTHCGRPPVTYQSRLDAINFHALPNAAEKIKHFLDPITGKIIDDPIVLRGDSFDRASLLALFSPEARSASSQTVLIIHPTFGRILLSDVNGAHTHVAMKSLIDALVRKQEAKHAARRALLPPAAAPAPAPALAAAPITIAAIKPMRFRFLANRMPVAAAIPFNSPDGEIRTSAERLRVVDAENRAADAQPAKAMRVECEYRVDDPMDEDSNDIFSLCRTIAPASPGRR